MREDGRLQRLEHLEHGLLAPLLGEIGSGGDAGGVGRAEAEHALEQRRGVEAIPARELGHEVDALLPRAPLEPEELAIDPHRLLGPLEKPRHHADELVHVEGRKRRSRLGRHAASMGP